MRGEFGGGALFSAKERSGSGKSVLGLSRLFPSRPVLACFVERTPEQSLDHRLAAYIKSRGAGVQVTQHTLGQIDVDATYGPNDCELVGEVGGNVFATSRFSGDLIGRESFLKCFRHSYPLPVWSHS